MIYSAKGGAILRSETGPAVTPPHCLPSPPPLHFVSAGLKPEAAQDDYEPFSERISRKSQTYELDNFSEKVTFD